jgi:hypothetical protein
VSQLTGGILHYSLHIGKFELQRRLGRRLAIIEGEAESQIGIGFNLGLDGMTLQPEVVGRHHPAQSFVLPSRSCWIVG